LVFLAAARAQSRIHLSVEVEPEHRATEPMRARRILQTIVVLVLWGLITHGTYAGSGDEPHYLAIAHSIAFDGDLDLANNYGEVEPLIAGGHLRPDAHVQPGVGGVARPVHDVGLPLLFAPYVRVAVPLTHALVRVIPPAAMQRVRLTPALLYRHLLSAAMIALTAILAGLLFDCLIDIGASIGFAVLTTLLIVLAPPVLIMSSLFFTELLSALLCLVVFRRVALIETSGTARWALLGLATGALFLIHARNIGLVVPLAGMAAFQLARRPSGERAAFVVAMGIALALRTWLNEEFWGTLLQGPHARLAWTGTGDAIQQMATRLTALIADQEFGLLPYAPIYAMGIGGAFVLARDKPAIALAIAIICGVYVGLIVCPVTNVHGWQGGWSPAARFLTPVVPLMGLFVYAGLRESPRAIAAPILVLQIAISAYAWQHPKILWNDGDGIAAFCETTAARVCAWLPSFPGP
jgi:hypothetical protein